MHSKAIAVTRGGKTLTFTVSPADYMGLAVKAGSQLGLNRAFYNYYQKAAALLGSNQQLGGQSSGGQQPSSLTGGNAAI